MVGFQNKCLAMAIRLHKTRGHIESEGGSIAAENNDSSIHGDEKLLLTTHLTQSTEHTLCIYSTCMQISAVSDLRDPTLHA